jgi:RNase P subunit RPR2
MRSLMQDRKQFVVVCKSCRLDVPAGVKEFPFRSILVTCPLCGELHRYLPSEMIMARPNPLVAKQA